VLLIGALREPHRQVLQLWSGRGEIGERSRTKSYPSVENRSFGAQGRNRTLAYLTESPSFFVWRLSSVPTSGPGAFSGWPGRCYSVPPYPSRARVTRYAKEIISAVWCAKLQIGLVIKVRSPPKAKVTRSNRVGCATSVQNWARQNPPFLRLKRRRACAAVRFSIP
jgi:hypothetical protein